MKTGYVFASIGLVAFIFFALSGGLPGRDEAGVFLSRSSDTKNQPPQLAQVAIFPPTPSRQSTLVVHVEAKDENQDEISYQYRWLVNQNIVSEADHLPLIRFKPGDQVSVEVTPFDGKALGPSVKAPSVNIGNSAPKISVLQLAIHQDDQGSAILVATEGFDLEGDEIHYVYQWRINGEFVTGNDAARLDAALYHDKDKIVVMVTPRDEFSQGQSKIAAMRVMNNFRPRITSQPPTDLTNGIYSYQILSEDLDKDGLSYSLMKGPAGMTLHADSGLLTWKVVPVSKEQSEVMVQVVDGRGGQDHQEFTIQVAE